MSGSIAVGGPHCANNPCFPRKPRSTIDSSTKPSSCHSASKVSSSCLVFAFPPIKSSTLSRCIGRSQTRRWSNDRSMGARADFPFPRQWRRTRAPRMTRKSSPFRKLGVAKMQFHHAARNNPRLRLHVLRALVGQFRGQGHGAMDVCNRSGFR